MKNSVTTRIHIIAVILAAASAVTFGQVSTGATKSTTKTALTRSKPDRATTARIAGVAKERIIKGNPTRRALDPSRFTSPVLDGVIIICDLPGTKDPDPFSQGDGFPIAVINNIKATKFLAADFYTVNLGQSGTDASGVPLYYLTLINSSGIQALSIGAKTNGAAGNSTGLGAKRLDNRGPKPGAGTPNNTIDRMAQFGARFIVEGKFRSLKTEGLDAAIMDLVGLAAVEGCQTCDCNGRKVYVCGNNGSCTKECARESDDDFRDATKPKN